MLKQRILTALVLVPAVVALVLLAPTRLLAPLLGVVVLLGALEWARLSGVTHPIGRALYLVATTLLMVASEWLRQQQMTDLLYLAASLWWLAVLGLILAQRNTAVGLATSTSLLSLVVGEMVLVPSWIAMVELHARPVSGPGLLLFVLVMIWVADSGAYFAGRRWGKTKLAPAVSPGKTWEGVLGAVAGMLLAGVGLYYWGALGGVGLLPLLLLCLAAGLFSIVGDLFESLVKRRRGMKDSGNLLPGHGGVLDRIDSLTAALPLFLFGLSLLGTP